jgi:DNA ligase-1
MEGFKPLLAVEADRAKIRFPVMESPKLDGIRCVKLGGRALSRNLKPIPNLHVRALVEELLLDGMDGELILRDPTAPFREVTSAVMKRSGTPDVRFALFDICTGEPYEYRLKRCRAFCDTLQDKRARDFVSVVPTSMARDMVWLEEAHKGHVEAGYEGTMIRDPNGPYKFGRSTVREGILLKLKDFTDEEAGVIGWEPLRKNTNELKEDELGYAKRSSAKEGLVDLELLGALTVATEDGAIFSIGSGFTLAERAALYCRASAALVSAYPGLIGQLVTFKHQPPPGGRKPGEAPRFPVFKGFRDPIDL